MAASELLTVLFVDVADSTRLLVGLGDERGRAVIVEVLDRMQALVEAARGRVWDRIGDELMCTLPSPEAAWTVSVGLQEFVTAEVFEGRQVRVRVGFHHGEVRIEDGALFGDTVHTARRMASTAKAQQIVTTAETLEALADGPPLPTREVGRMRIAGHAEPVVAQELLWNPEDSTTMALPESAPQTLGRLFLHFEGDTVVLGAKKADANIGREPGSDIVALGSLVSRRHARVEVRGTQFVLIDMSTNGTRICWPGTEPLMVRRSEAPLRGQGELRFGPADGPQDVDPIAFEVRPG